MEHDELMRIRGEQVTLQMEVAEKRSQFTTERQGLLALTNELQRADSKETGWLDVEIARLKRLHALQVDIAALDLRIKQLKRVSGI